jgi:hypothetical protein
MTTQKLKACHEGEQLEAPECRLCLDPGSTISQAASTLALSSQWPCERRERKAVAPCLVRAHMTTRRDTATTGLLSPQPAAQPHAQKTTLCLGQELTTMLKETGMNDPVLLLEMDRSSCWMPLGMRCPPTACMPTRCACQIHKIVHAASSATDTRRLLFSSSVPGADSRKGTPYADRATACCLCKMH